MPVVRIPDDQFDRLKKHAEPLVDSVGDVLGRILDSFDPTTRQMRDIRQEDFGQLWNVLGRKFNSIDAKFFANPFPTKRTWNQIRTGRADIHYEWLVHKGDARLDVALHFEANDGKLNAARLASLAKHSVTITKGIGEEYRSRTWHDNDKWGEIAFRVPYKNSVITEPAIELAAWLMKTLIDRTWDLVKNA